MYFVRIYDSVESYFLVCRYGKNLNSQINPDKILLTISTFITLRKINKSHTHSSLMNIGARHHDYLATKSLTVKFDDLRAPVWLSQCSV